MRQVARGGHHFPAGGVPEIPSRRRRRGERKEVMREKSNSITHLVKMVAREVCEEMIEELKESTETYRINLTKAEKSFCETIQVSVENAGWTWSEEEDDLLVQEVKTAVAQIALNHKRSRGAIGSRIRQKELVVAS